jgi:hypothetical protein
VIAIGPSLITGANEAGKVFFQPWRVTLEKRKACKGPGCRAAAIAKPEPIKMLSITYSLPPKMIHIDMT